MRFFLKYFEFPEGRKIIEPPLLIDYSKPKHREMLSFLFAYLSLQLYFEWQ